MERVVAGGHRDRATDADEADKADPAGLCPGREVATERIREDEARCDQTDEEADEEGNDHTGLLAAHGLNLLLISRGRG